MFKEFGQMAGLLTQLPKIKQEMESLQARLEELTAEGDAGAGMVKAKINGRMRLLSCTISSEAMGDREMLEDLVVAAVNQAVDKVRQLSAQETSKVATNLGLPAGMNIPGLTPGA